MRKLKPLIWLVGALFSVSALAAGAPTSKGNGVEKGWFYFDDPVKKEKPKEEPPPEVPQMVTSAPPPPKEEACKTKETWKPDCGFVNPGTDFAFQAKQRDALMERMTVSNNDPKAVEDFQYYMRWVLDRTSEVTNLWWYNMAQNPDLDPTVQAPVSTFGLRLMTDVKKGKTSEIFSLIKQEGGFFVYFSRSDCAFCHQMKDVLRGLESDTGLVVRNASLDDQCMPGFEEGCIKAPESIAPAQALQVSIVPSVFLYVPANTWLRVSTGVTDKASIVSRASQFFAAYRNALLTGADNSVKGRPAVDFGATAARGTAGGVGGSSGERAIKPPSEDEILNLFGASNGAK